MGKQSGNGNGVFKFQSIKQRDTLKYDLSLCTCVVMTAAKDKLLSYCICSVEFRGLFSLPDLYWNTSVPFERNFRLG